MKKQKLESLIRLKRHRFTNFNIWILLTPFLFGLALSIVVPSIALSEPYTTSFVLENTVNPEFSKPGEEVTLTVAYSNNMDKTAYNVTIFKWMSSNLTFVNSEPFYDGASDSRKGFYRWSRGDILPYETGVIVIKALVNNIPVGSEIIDIVHLTYEFENGTGVEVTADAKITVLQAAGVDVSHDQIHSVAPRTGEWTGYNVSISNTGNSLDTFGISLKSIAYNPSGSTHKWKIEMYSSEGYPQENPLAIVYTENQENRTSWTDHGILSNFTLESGESTWIIIKVFEAEGTSGSGDAYLNVQLTATSLFDPSVLDSTKVLTIVKSVAGITLAPDYLTYANPGDLIFYRHIIINSGQTEVIDLDYQSPMEWDYSFSFDNGTALEDTDNSGYVDIGKLPKNEFVYILVKVIVPHGTAADTTDQALITVTGVVSRNLDTVNDTITIKSTPLLAVDKKLISENPAYQGDTVTYQINITNLGNTKLTRIPLYDTYETSCLDFINAYPTKDVNDEIAGTIHWENLTALEPGQSIIITVNYAATSGEDQVRQSANVIDAEDEFGNLISNTYINEELIIIGASTLTVKSSPTSTIGASFWVTWIEHGISRNGTFSTEKQITCDKDTVASISYLESPITNGDVRYLFSHYSPNSTVLMDAEKTITLNYETEYLATFEQEGSYEDVYITVGGAELPEALPQSLWIPKDSIITFSYPSTVTDAIGTSRYVFTGMSDNIPDSQVTIEAPTEITGFYKTQYYLELTTDPVDLDVPQGSGWYDKGTYVLLIAKTPLEVDNGSTRYRFDHWTGLGIANKNVPSTEIFMNSPKEAVAHYIKQYKLTVISDHGSPVPSVGEHWRDEGEVIVLSVDSPADESHNLRYRCSGWSGAGSIPKEGADTQLNFTILSPSSIEWIWKTQYYLTVGTDPADLDHPMGEGWYDHGTYAAISINSPTGGDGVWTRYRFQKWRGVDIVDPYAKSTKVLVNRSKAIEAVFIQQFHLTMTTNLGSVHPESGWYDIGSTVSIEATVSTVTEGQGFVWHGWTGIGEGSYSGMDNPNTVTIYDSISETAYWKIEPSLTVLISNKTIAEGDTIIVYGKTLPVEAGVQILVTYTLPNGTQIEHAVYTDDEGNYEDTMLLKQDYIYDLLVRDGEWVISACRLGDRNHESAQAFTKLKIEPRSVMQFSPFFLGGAVMVGGLIAYIPYVKKMRNKKTWWRITVILSTTGLILGIISLTLNWMLVAGTAVTNNTDYQVDISVRPFQNGLVSITDGIQYEGDIIPSMVNLSWQTLVGSSGPVLTFYLVSAVYVLALIGLYRPKKIHQKRLKVVILLMSAVIVAATVIHTFIFANGQANVIDGADIGFGIGAYMAVLSCVLLVFSGFSANSEILGDAAKAEEFSSTQSEASTYT